MGGDVNGRGVPGGDAETEGKSTGDQPAIRVRDLRKRFQASDVTVTAVDGISFAVERGSIVGLLGPNGAGKTTTIKSMLGLVVPDDGTVEICGTDVFAEPERAHARTGAMLEGDRNVYWRLTVRENLAFFAGLGGHRPAAVRDRHDRLLERLGIAERADTVVNELSRGMKQKVSLASTLARDVDVVFLDEPTLGLDVETANELIAELRRLADEDGVTIVLTSHDMDVIEAVSDRVVILQDGRIVADDAVENLVGLFRSQACRITLEGTIDESTRQRLQEAFDLSLQSDGRLCHLTCHDARIATLADLLPVLDRTDAELREIQSIDPDLEEAFLRLTGADDAGPPEADGVAAPTSDAESTASQPDGGERDGGQ